MRHKIGESEVISLICGEDDSEEEKIWVHPRVPTETILCREGLSIVEPFDWNSWKDQATPFPPHLYLGRMCVNF